jgi:hypothetical protein
MGYGTYPRIVLARTPDERVPTNFVVVQDGGYRFLSLHAGLPIYFGQRSLCNRTSNIGSSSRCDRQMGWARSGSSSARR